MLPKPGQQDIAILIAAKQELNKEGRGNESSRPCKRLFGCQGSHVLLMLLEQG